MKKYNVIYIVVIMIMIISFVLFGNYKKNVASSIDNRYLAEFPQKISNSFTKELTDYTQDRIGFRDSMISLYTNFNNKVFQIFPNNIYGKHGNLFGNGEAYLASYQHLNGDDEYAEYFAEYIKKLQNFCEAREIDFVYMLNPDKTTTYPEEMPESIGVYSAENLTEQIKRHLINKNVRSVFVDEVFKEVKSKELLFYKVYDPSHWSDYGRIVGVNSVLEELSLNELSLKEDFERKEVLAVKQQTSAVVINDSLIGYKSKYLYDKQDIKGLETLDLVNPDAFGVFKNCNSQSNKKPKLLLLCDSYLLNNFDYFGDNFSEIVGVHAYDLPKIQMLISLFEPDIVIFENVERAMDAFYPKDLIKAYGDVFLPDYSTFSNLPEKKEKAEISISYVNGIEVQNECKGDVNRKIWSIEGMALDNSLSPGAAIYASVGKKIYLPVQYMNGQFKFIIDLNALKDEEEIQFLLIDDLRTAKYKTSFFDVILDE